jgi:hypothetical protein
VSLAEHIDPESALFLAALDDSDPEKRSALAHALGCASCQRLMRESQSMLQLIDREPALAEVDAALEARIQAAVLGTRRAPGHRFEYLAWLLGALASSFMIWLDAKPASSQSLYVDVGLRCLRFELVFGGIAFGAGMLVARRLGRELDPLRASVLAMTGALAGQALLRMRCEAADAALHLLAFHLVGVLVATALGAGAARLFAKAT